MKLRFIIAITLSLLALKSQGQLKVNLDTTNRHYIGIKGSGQFWLRHIELNPGSVVNGSEQSSVTDVSIRRLRLKLYGQLTDQLGLVFQVGQNNLNTNSKENVLKILDAYACYQIKPWLNVGAGKSAWVGLSRYAAPGTSSLVSSDIFFSALPAINVYDDMMRRPSVLSYGQIGNWDYRVAIAKPYLETKTVAPMDDVATFAYAYSPYQSSWYVKYQFLDKEKQSSSFAPQFYMGRKNILNVGIGQLYQPKAMWYLSEGDTTFHSIHMKGLDVFGQLELNAKMDIIFYGSYLNANLGKNFVRNVGANNAANGAVTESLSFNGKGNSYPAAGTGNIWMSQVAMNIHLGNDRIIQPGISHHYADYDGLDDGVNNYDFTINYFPNDLHSKISLGFQNQPLFENREGKITAIDRKNLFILQYQFKF